MVQMVYLYAGCWYASAQYPTKPQPNWEHQWNDKKATQKVLMHWMYANLMPPIHFIYKMKKGKKKIAIESPVNWIEQISCFEVLKFLFTIFFPSFSSIIFYYLSEQEVGESEVKCRLFGILCVTWFLLSHLVCSKLLAMFDMQLFMEMVLCSTRTFTFKPIRDLHDKIIMLFQICATLRNIFHFVDSMPFTSIHIIIHHQQHRCMQQFYQLNQ